jgi:hypothetical protein
VEPSIRQEVFHAHAGLAQDGPKSSFRHVAWVIGDSGLALTRCLLPHFVGACRLAIKSKPKVLQRLHHIAVAKA